MEDGPSAWAPVTHQSPGQSLNHDWLLQLTGGVSHWIKELPV